MKSWIKNLIFLGGLLLFLISVSIGLKLQKEEKQSKLRDGTKTAYAMIDETTPLCLWDVQVSQRVMTENTSQTIVIITSNPAKKECGSLLSIRATGFDISPSKDEQKVTLASGANGSISWTITPRKIGAYDIVVSDIINTKIFGITVTNVFGLNAFQAQIFSIFGSLFGPMFTIPWWWDRLRQRKKDQAVQKDSEKLQ